MKNIQLNTFKTNPSHALIFRLKTEKDTKSLSLKTLM